MRAKEWKLGFAYTVRARYGPVLTSSDDSGVVVMVSRPSAVTRSYACLGQRVLVVLELLLSNEGCSRCSFEGASDGAVACHSRHHRVLGIAEIERNSEYLSQIF